MFENMNNSKKTAIIGAIVAAFAALFYFVGDLNSANTDTEISDENKLAATPVAETQPPVTTEVTAEKVIESEDENPLEIVITPESSEKIEE